MSQTNIIRFCQLARTDEMLSSRLQALPDNDTNTAINALINIANDQGLPFSRDEYFDYLISIQMNGLDS